MLSGILSFIKKTMPALALAAALAVLAGCGSNPDKDFSDAADAMKAKNLPEAERLARKTLVNKPDYMPAYLLLGRIGVVKEEDESAKLNYRTVYDLMSGRQYKLRAEDVRASNMEPPFQWQEAIFYLADAEFKTMNYNQAIKYYDILLEDSGSSAWTRKASDEKQAVREFIGYRSKLDMLRAQNYKNPKDPKIQAEMSSLFMDMASGMARLGKMKVVSEQVGLAGKFREQAREALKSLYSASPEIKLPQTEALLDYTESQESLMRGNSGEALNKAMSACRNDPSNAKYHFTVASLIAVIGKNLNDPAHRMPERMEYARKAVELDPAVWRYQTAYAGLLKETGQLRGAYEMLLKARETATDKDIKSQIDSVLADIEKQMGNGRTPTAGQ